MSKLHKFVLAALLCVSAAANAGAGLLTNGANVTESGASFGDSAGWGGGLLAPANSITNGTFLPMGNQWNTGTVFWNGTDPYLQINLNTTYHISDVVLEADNNDLYQVSYLHNGVWSTLGDLSPTLSGTVNANGTINQTGSVSWGLGLAGLASSVTASAFRIQAVGGDNLYGVGQFQAYGVPAVPEAGTNAMMAAGLCLLAFATRRRFKA